MMNDDVTGSARAQLGLVDLILLIGSMLLCGLVGLYFSNKNKSLKSYMLADGQLPVTPVALSLMTSCMSGIMLLGSSAEIYYQGPSYAFVALAMLLAGPITAYTILPVFYRLNELSLYKFLERRYGLWVKYIVNSIFIIQMIFYNAVVLYIPAMALQSVLNISKFYSILTIGLICVSYSGVGGIKAVVWTDFIQGLLMYISIFVVAFIGTQRVGGLSQVYQLALAGDRLNLDGFFKIDSILTSRHTLGAILIGSTLHHTYIMGANQVQIQRALSLNSLAKAQLAFILCSLFACLLSLLSTYMGLVIYATYGDCDPYLGHQIPKRDALILHFVQTQLSGVMGLRGIFIAGIFSATLSTLSSFANSMAALALEDYVRPLIRWWHRGDEKQLKGNRATWVAKFLATFFGFVCVLAAYAIDQVNSRLLQAVTTMLTAFGSPFLAAFAMGIFTRFINTAGILAGFAVTLTLGSYITIKQTFLGKPLEPSLYTYYDNQVCFFNLNYSLTSNNFSSVTSRILMEQEEASFSLDKISYMMLPAVQFLLTCLVAGLVSLLTGGWHQQVDASLLVNANSINRGSNDESLHEFKFKDGKLSGRKLNMFAD